MYRVRTILMLLGMLLCPQINAAEVAVVGAHFEGLTPGEVASITEVFVKAVQAEEGFEAVGPNQLKSRLLGRQELVLSDMAISDGRKKLEEGKLLYDRAQPSPAIDELNEAIKILVHSVGVTGETRHLRDAYLFKGLSHTGLGEMEEAKKAFAQAVVLDPTLELDPLRYPPRVQQRFAEIRDRIRSREPATLHIQVPAGMEAEIWVDGRRRGMAPLSVEGLTQGRHYVRAVGPGIRRGYKAPQLAAGQVLPLFLPMDQHGMGRVASKEDARRRQAANLYQSLGQHTATDLVLVLNQRKVRENILTAQLYSPRSDRFSNAVSLELPTQRSMMTLNVERELAELLSFVTAQGDINTGKLEHQAPDLKINSNPVLTGLLLRDLRKLPEPREPRPEEKGPAADRTWLQRYKWWLIGGSAVVVGGATVAVAVTSSGGGGGSITVGPIP